MGILTRLTGWMGRSEPVAPPVTPAPVVRSAPRRARWDDEENRGNGFIGVRPTAADLASARKSSVTMAIEDPHMAAAERETLNYEVGWGIRPRSASGNEGVDAERMRVWRRWAEKTHCDAEGRTNLYGLQRLARRVARRYGSALIRQRIVDRRTVRGRASPLPLKLQVLSPDYLDTSRDGPTASGGVIINGIEFDKDANRVAYWIHRARPGDPAWSRVASTLTSVRVPADEVIHLFEATEPGQVDGAPEAVAAMHTLQDVADTAEAWLFRSKGEAAIGLAVEYPDDGTPPANVGEDMPEGANREDDRPIRGISPGMVHYLPKGTKLVSIAPSSSGGQDALSKRGLMSSAAGMGLGYDQVSGDVSQSNYTSMRASRIGMQRNTEVRQWVWLIPQMCDPIWLWFCDAGALMGLWPGDDEAPFDADWNPPPVPVVEPDKDFAAIIKAVRSGIMTWRQAVEAMGNNADEQLAEIGAWNARLDAAGVKLDVDPRHLSQQGQAQKWESGAQTPDPGSQQP